MPVVDATRSELKHDFAPFAALKDLPMAMSAHLLYTAIDPHRPATASPIVVAEIMRGEIGFDGLILSDDLSMKALTGSFEQRAAAVIEAGLDIVLHCNGNLEEGRAVASATPALSGASLRRVKAAEAAIKAPQPFDVERGERELAAIMAELGVGVRAAGIQAVSRPRGYVQFCARRSDFKGLSVFFCNANKISVVAPASGSSNDPGSNSIYQYSHISI